MNIIIDGLPETIKTDKGSHPIITDFRASMLFEIMMLDPDMTKEEKLEETVEIYVPDYHFDSAEDLEAVIDQILWFYRCGRQEDKNGSSGSSSGSVPYSFEHDTDFLIASFMEAYGIDLTTEKMHWWKFKALFNNLPESTPMRQAIYYRICDIPGKASREEKERIRKLKEYYKLPVILKPEESKEIDDINEILMNGGDLTGYLRSK